MKFGCDVRADDVLYADPGRFFFSLLFDWIFPGQILQLLVIVIKSEGGDKMWSSYQHLKQLRHCAALLFGYSRVFLLDHSEPAD